MNSGTNLGKLMTNNDSCYIRAEINFEMGAITNFGRKLEDVHFVHVKEFKLNYNCVRNSTRVVDTEFKMFSQLRNPLCCCRDIMS